jgi:SAM-dependent methyltransferase
MQSPSDIYRDYADFYDLYVGEWMEDLPFYLSYARRITGPVLEIGAGTGRLTFPLARAGMTVVAVDVSPSMLRLLREKWDREAPEVQERVHIIEADATALNFGRTFELILLPFYTFNYFMTLDSQVAVLQTLRRHLAPHGRLLMDLFLPLRHILNCPKEPVVKADRIVPETGARFKAWNRYQMDRERQVETRHHVFELHGSDSVIQRREFTTHRRYHTPDQIQALAGKTGWEVEALYGGYEKKPIPPDVEQFVADLTPA